MEIMYEWHGNRAVRNCEARRISLLLEQLSPGKEIAAGEQHEWVSAKGNHVVFARDRKVVNRTTRLLVGMAMVTFRLSHEGRVGLVDEVCVDKPYRGHGIGRALMQAIHDCARRHQAIRLDLTSNQSRAEAHALYESLGYVQRDTRVYRLML